MLAPASRTRCLRSPLRRKPPPDVSGGGFPSYLGRFGLPFRGKSDSRFLLAALPSAAELSFRR